MVLYLIMSKLSNSSNRKEICFFKVKIKVQSLINEMKPDYYGFILDHVKAEQQFKYKRCDLYSFARCKKKNIFFHRFRQTEN